MLLPLALRSSGRSVRKATAIVPWLMWLSTKRIGLPLRSLGPGWSAAPARGAAVAVRARALSAARMREEEDMPPMVGRRRAPVMTTKVAGGVTWLGPPRRAPPQAIADDSGRAGPLPDVDPGVHGVLLDLRERVVVEVQAPERADVVLELRDAARPDQRRGHPGVAQRPRQRELGQRLPPALRDLVQRADAREVLVAEHGLRQRPLARGAGVLGDAVQVAVGEHPLPEGREDDRPHALAAEDVEQVGLDPAVEQRVGRLVDEQRRAEVAQDPDGLLGALRGVRRDAGVERLALSHRGVEGAERLLERRVGVQAVRVEDVDVVQAHAPEALVEAREDVLARAPFPVGAGPHVVARLGRDDQLVAPRAQVLGQQAPEVDLGRAVGGAVVVGQVEVGDPQVEGAPDDRPLGVDRAVVAEVLPQAEGDGRQLQAAAPAAAVGHVVVAVFGGDVGHGAILAYGVASWPLPSSPAPVSPSSRSSTTTVGCSSRRPWSTPSISSNAGSPRSSSRGRRASRGRSTSTSASSCARPPQRPSTGAPRSSSAPGTSTTRAPRGSSGPRAMPAPPPCWRSRPRTPTTCARTTRRWRPTPALWPCWPTTSPPSRRRASRSRSSPSCRSPGSRTPPATPDASWPSSAPTTARCTSAPRPTSRWPARSGPPAPSCPWPTRTPRAASPPWPATWRPSGRCCPAIASRAWTSPPASSAGSRAWPGRRRPCARAEATTTGRCPPARAACSSSPRRSPSAEPRSRPRARWWRWPCPPPA